MKRFRIFETVSGWVIFVVAAITYLMTIEPSVSFWDCGEFTASADKLEVGHPPGAPFFMLVGRIFAIFASDPTHVAKMMNSFSALCSAFTILFLFWTITHLAKNLLFKEDGEISMIDTLQIIGAGVVGALAYTFSDTFWFSAVESEVYAFSSFFTAIVFWCILMWEKSEGNDIRWLILIAYLMGLSIGVHLLNLLTIPAIVLVYYFKKTEKVDWRGVVKALVSSGLILLFVLYGLIPGFTKVVGVIELLFVNSFGLPFNSGLIFYLLLIAALFVWTLYETHTLKSPVKIKISFAVLIFMLGVPFLGDSIWLGILLTIAGAFLLYYKRDWNYKWFNTIAMCTLVIIIGYSSYAMIMIRSAANPSMDQNSPEDVFSLKSYLNREQYGDRPLFYGRSFASPVDYRPDGQGRCSSKIIYGPTNYIKKNKENPNEKDRYISIGKAQKGVEYVSAGKMLFPRMYSTQGHHVDAYKQWTNFKGKKIRVNQCGNIQDFVVPTMAENIKFFFSYQLNFMYFRYFMWNFVGRQNDVQSNNGEIDAGQWISGISFIDNALYGDQSKLPDNLKNNKGHNTYYFLPLILGILGILWQLANSNKGKQQFWLTFTLFFMTGIAIVMYINQTPYQPRERDYSYAGSFYAFSIWIGLGMLYVVQLLRKIKLPKTAAVVVAFVLSMIIPVLMCSQNWDDHDRSDRYICRDMGYNYLNSCDDNAILFCNGDNDTFPLWYCQEVESVRDDIRTCNLSYISASWYIDQMTRDYYNGKALPIDLRPDEYQRNTLDAAIVKDHPEFKNGLNVDDAFRFLRDKSLQQENIGFMFSKKLKFPVDKQKVIEAGIVDQSQYDLIVDTIYLTIDKEMLGKGDLAVLNILKNNDWTRPIYFCITVGSEFYPTNSISEYLQTEGLAYRFVPLKKRKSVNTKVMYDNIMNKFKFNLAGKDLYLDETNVRMCKTLRQSFAMLATSLLEEGDSVRAAEVLQRGINEIPESILSYDYSMLAFVDCYFRLGDKENAESILAKVMELTEQNIMYVLSLPIEKQNFVSPEISARQNMAIMQQAMFMANNNGSAMFEDISTKFQKYYQILAPRLQQ